MIVKVVVLGSRPQTFFAECDRVNVNVLRELGEGGVNYAIESNQEMPIAGQFIEPVVIGSTVKSDDPDSGNLNKVCILYCFTHCEGNASIIAINYEAIYIIADNGKTVDRIH